MPSPLGEILPDAYRASATVATLGPAGTDAHAEADRHFGRILLADSFNGAMELGLAEGVLVLVAAGFVERDASTVVDSWVDMHFRNLDLMRLVATWESPTKPMCVATNRARAAGIEEMSSVSLHPATAAFAKRYAPRATHAYVNAKPIAVQWASEGRVDGCIGSLDVVRKSAELEVHRIWQPTMVWCLYEPRSGPRPTGDFADDQSATLQRNHWRHLLQYQRQQ